MPTYRITYADGRRDTEHASIALAELAIRTQFTGAEIGHPGDLRGGGNRTLFWADDAAATEDAGSLALGYIVRT